MIDLGLKNKLVLVTGASSVLGQCIAVELAKEGANLILHYNYSSDKIDGLTSYLDKIGCLYRLIKADFSILSDVYNMLRQLQDLKCHIDVLINNASINHKKNIVYMDMEEYERIMNVNLKTPYILCKNIMRSMVIRKNGIIVNISSCITKHSRANESAYGISKGGIEAMTKLLATEAGTYRIRVNCVAPGPFSSPMNRLYKENKNEIIKSNAIKDIVTPEKISKVILFLCSDYSSAITGQIINVDNGFEL